MNSSSLSSDGFSVPFPPFAARKRPPLQPLDRNIGHPQPSAGLDAMDETAVGPSSATAALTAAMLDTDDPFNTKKKSSAVSMDELPIGGSRAAQAMAPSYYEHSDASSVQAETDSRPPTRTATAAKSREATRESSNRQRGAAADESGSQLQPSSGDGTAVRRPPLRARLAGGGRQVGSKPAGERDEEKDDSGQKVATADGGLATDEAPIRSAQPRPPSSASSASSLLEADEAPLPRSSAATLLAMLDTDDPFNSKKKPASSALSDDAPHHRQPQCTERASPAAPRG